MFHIGNLRILLRKGFESLTNSDNLCPTFSYLLQPSTCLGNITFELSLLLNKGDSK